MFRKFDSPLAVLIGRLVALLGLIGTCITIFTFVTGVPSLDSFWRSKQGWETSIATQAQTVATQVMPASPSKTPRASSCPGAPPQRLAVKGRASVCTARDAVYLRQNPGKQYTVIKTLVPGADLTITDGPVCSDNWSWWKVKTESGYIGWISEGGDTKDQYFLCPAP